MFSVRHSYQGPLGEVKFSHAFSHAHFKNKTKGLALKYVSQGQETYFTSKEKLSVKQGQFIILKQNQAYETFTPHRNTSNLGICIDFNPDKFQDSSSDIFDSELLFGMVFPQMEFEAIGKKVQDLSQQGGSPSMIELYALLENFFQTIQGMQHALQINIKKTSTQKGIIHKLLLAKNYIHLHYSHPISLEKLAREAAISPYHLNRLFKNCFGQTPFELQLDLKMQAAQRLLKQDLSLSQIALDLGYHDLAAFSRQFKKYWSETPSAFRKRI